VSGERPPDGVDPRTIREVAATTTPEADGARVTERLDRLVSTAADRAVDDADSAADRYLACVTEIAAADRDPTWLPWLVGDALARTARTPDSPFGDRASQVDVVARVAALAVHHRWRAVDGLELGDDPTFERIVTGVRTVESDDRQFFERVIRETAALLDEEHPGTAVLDWQDAFDAV
jgi:hypothetical protein